VPEVIFHRGEQFLVFAAVGSGHEQGYAAASRILTVAARAQSNWARWRGGPPGFYRSAAPRLARKVDARR
jgi:hypothetical protein